MLAEVVDAESPDPAVSLSDVVDATELAVTAVSLSDVVDATELAVTAVSLSDVVDATELTVTAEPAAVVEVSSAATPQPTSTAPARARLEVKAAKRLGRETKRDTGILFRRGGRYAVPLEIPVPRFRALVVSLCPFCEPQPVVCGSAGDVRLSR
ncbi:hypothetical protein GCM10028781_13900 [Nostocoides australiense]